MVGTRGHRRSGQCLAAILAASSLALIVGVAAPVARAVSAPDRQATLAYLQAKYEYDVAVGAAARGAIGGATAFAAGVEAGCRNALAGLPAERVTFTKPEPRAEGQAARREHDRTAVELELSAGTEAAYHGARAGAQAKLAAAVAPLRWSDPRIASAVASYLASEQSPEPAPPGPAEACADLRSWTQSGFRDLAQRTKTIDAAREAEIDALSEPSVETLLKPYEDPAASALVRRTARLQVTGTLPALKRLARTELKLREAVGIEVPKALRPPKITNLAKGGTHSGLEYRVSEETPEGFHRPGCRLQVTVSYLPPRAAEQSLIILGTSTPGLCVAGRAMKRSPELECEYGSLTIAQPLDRRVRSVRLRLADGRALTSRAIVLRPAHGSPAQLYVQAIERLSSPPVSLTELDASGSVVAVVAVPKHRTCPRAEPEEPLSTPLVAGVTPVGSRFTIEALSFVGVEGRAHSSLFVRSGFEDSSEVTFGGGAARRGFDASLRDGCEPGEWSLVYGILKPPAASATASTPGGTVTLTTVPVSPALHLGGTVLAYGAFAGLPSEVTVRDAAGRVIENESLARRATEHHEFCEGYAEG